MPGFAKGSDVMVNKTVVPRKGALEIPATMWKPSVTHRSLELTHLDWAPAPLAAPGVVALKDREKFSPELYFQQTLMFIKPQLLTDSNYMAPGEFSCFQDLFAHRNIFYHLSCLDATAPKIVKA